MRWTPVVPDHLIRGRSSPLGKSAPSAGSYTQGAVPVGLPANIVGAAVGVPGSMMGSAGKSEQTLFGQAGGKKGPPPLPPPFTWPPPVPATEPPPFPVVAGGSLTLAQAKKTGIARNAIPLRVL